MHSSICAFVIFHHVLQCTIHVAKLAICNMQTFKTLASLCSLADWFEHDLFANSLNRFPMMRLQALQENIFTDHSKAVILLWIIYVFLSCFCYAFMRICLLMPCGHLLGKG